MRKTLKKIREFLKHRGIGTRGLLCWLVAAAVTWILCTGLVRMSSPGNQVFPVYITEILASNTGYPNSGGRCCDYIELYNSADHPVDLSGFQLGDVSGKSRYAFPAGTVLQAGEYLAVYCDKTADDPAYAPFEINRAGGESFFLIARNSAIVGSVTTVPLDIDQAMTVQEDGSWVVSQYATPGYANRSVAPDRREVFNPKVSSVCISEISSGETGYLGNYGVRCDWIELHNTGSQAADISGFILSDNPGNDKYIFPQGTAIAPGGYLVVNCTDLVSDPSVAPFKLSREYEETVVLKDSAGLIAHIVRSAPQSTGSLTRTGDGVWEASREMSPGYENSPEGCAAFRRETGSEAGAVRITEVMAAGQLVLPDEFGDFPDWVELHNTTDRCIDLSGWCLSDDPADPAKWTIPSLVLEPGQRQVIFCSGRDTAESGQLHTGFSLSAGGESLTLSARPGNVVDSVSFPASEDHCAYIFSPEEQAVKTDTPTPGYPNDPDGYDAFCGAAVPAGPLAIWEVMTSNDHYLPQLLGQCYDWVELRNISGSPIDLSGFSISDDLDIPGMHKLKGGTLAPGETVVLILSREENIAASGFEQAMLSLDAKEDQLFLFDEAGKLLDYVHLKDIPLGLSYGRSEGSGGFFHMEPSPQNPNFAGYRQISGPVAASHVPGVYSREDGFSVTLEADGAIYYTTDGSVPSASSTPYRDTLQISQNTVLRAVSIEKGKLAGPVYTATFIVGDTHDLPVVSLVTDPEGLWGKDGIYRNGAIWVKQTRLPAHLSYCGEDGSFAINCAVNLHGATTVEFFDKKTFAVRFQDRYDGPLHYDVFEDGEVTDFSSLLIRTAHESQVSSQMHDALIGYIASQSSDTVLSQKYKYVALYLNGEYWGLYALRERHSPEHYASYMQEPAEKVQIVRFMIDEDNTLHDLYDFCEHNSLASEENYAYAKSILHMESYADWIIYEAYMSNIDVNANLRFYQSPVDGLWRLGLADLDLGMVGSSAAFSSMATTFHHGRVVSAVFANEEFQDLIASRLAELLAGPLSDENMIAIIRQMADTIRPETVWEQARWGTPRGSWEHTVQEMIDFCDGRAREMIDSLCLELGLSKAEREAYFGDLE